MYLFGNVGHPKTTTSGHCLFHMGMNFKTTSALTVILHRDYELQLPYVLKHSLF